MGTGDTGMCIRFKATYTNNEKKSRYVMDTHKLQMYIIYMHLFTNSICIILHTTQPYHQHIYLFYINI